MNEIDLKARMILAGRNLVNALCLSRHFMPYWHMTLDNDCRGTYKFAQRCNSHNIGRWWAAMLPLEDATGFEIPLDVEAGQMANLERYTDNPAGILLDVSDYPEDRDDATKWYIHSFRETMLTFAALAKYRNNRRVVGAGRRAVEQMDKASQDLSTWDFSPVSQPTKINHPVYSHGRSMEGLIGFYQATGQLPALELAGRYARYHRRNTVRDDGSLAEDNGNHTHSYLNTLRGLLLYGKVIGEADYINVVKATYAHAVQEMITPSGFITHDICVDKAQLCVGDAASAGDVATIALWLWQQTKDNALLDDVERIVRARLLPAQVVQAADVKPLETGDGDEYRDLAQRMAGALGGATSHTFGKSAITDITAATLNSLIEVYNNVITVNNNEVRVNMHFSRRNQFASVSAQRGEKAKVAVTVFGPQNLCVRVPRWAPADSVTLLVNGAARPIKKQGDYICIGGEANGIDVELGYDLPERMETELGRCQYFDSSERLRPPMEKPRTYTLKWRGDEVIAAAPTVPYFPFYPEM